MRGNNPTDLSHFDETDSPPRVLSVLPTFGSSASRSYDLTTPLVSKEKGADGDTTYRSNGSTASWSIFEVPGVPRL